MVYEKDQNTYTITDYQLTCPQQAYQLKNNNRSFVQKDTLVSMANFNRSFLQGYFGIPYFQP
jgi:hypothetical protein